MAQPKPSLPRRVKVGIGATVVSLVFLAYPGQFALPVIVLIPLMPKSTGCFNFLAPFVFLLFVGVSLLLSVAIVGVGIVAVVLAALRFQAGLVMAVVFNAIVASLLLIGPLSFSAYGAPDQGEFGLFALLAGCAIVPIAALVLLLVPAAYRSSRVFTVTALAAALLLLPGVAGGVAFGLELAGFTVSQPANSQATGTQHSC